MSGFNTKALVKGDPQPADPAAGTLRLYGMRFCPYTHRVRLVLAHKKVPYEAVIINPPMRPDWFTSKNPHGQTPTLEKDGQCIWESAFLLDYLDEAYPETPLFPKDPMMKTKLKCMMDGSQKKWIGPYFKVLRGSPEEKENAKKMFTQGLTHLQSHLQGKFFGGEEPKMIDFFIYPLFERFPAVKKIFSESGFDPLPASEFPKLLEWVKNMSELDAVKACAMSQDHHEGFIRSVVEKGRPDVDFGL